MLTVDKVNLDVSLTARLGGLASSAGAKLSRDLCTASHLTRSIAQRDHVRCVTRDCKHARKSWRSGTSTTPAWVEVSPRWVPVDTHSTPVLGLPGRLWVAHRPRTTAQQRHDNLREHSSRDDEVPHGRGACRSTDPHFEVVTGSRCERVCCILRETP